MILNVNFISIKIDIRIGIQYFQIIKIKYLIGQLVMCLITGSRKCLQLHFIVSMETFFSVFKTQIQDFLIIGKVNSPLPPPLPGSIRLDLLGT